MLKDKLNILSVVLCIAVFVTINFGSRSLVESVISTYKKTEPVSESLKVGTSTYAYTISYYDPGVKFELIKDRSGARYETPEEAFISFLSAIVANDFDWWFDSFDQNRKKELLEKKYNEYEDWKNYKLKRDSDDLKNKSIELVAYIQYKNYVLIESVVSSIDGKESSKRIIPFKLEDNSWKVTIDKEAVNIMIFK